MLSLLLVTLPTQPNAVRLRIWRALKALGCVALRDGAYVLPESHSASLEQLAQEVVRNGGSAQVMTLLPKDDLQKADILAQFDRSDAYVAWHQLARELTQALPLLGENEARRRVRSTAEALQNVKRCDYYPGAAALQAEAAWQHAVGQSGMTTVALLANFPAKFEKAKFDREARMMLTPAEALAKREAERTDPQDRYVRVGDESGLFAIFDRLTGQTRFEDLRTGAQHLAQLNKLTRIPTPDALMPLPIPVTDDPGHVPDGN